VRNYEKGKESAYSYLLCTNLVVCSGLCQYQLTGKVK